VAFGYEYMKLPQKIQDDLADLTAKFIVKNRVSATATTDFVIEFAEILIEYLKSNDNGKDNEEENERLH
jgi:hypothetical protein